MNDPYRPPPPKQVVLVGAGHAHVEVLRAFGRHRLADARVTVITRDPRTAYSGMVSGLVADRYSPDDIYIDVGALAHRAEARLLVDEAVGIDLPGKRVLCRTGPPVPFDLLSLDVGSHAKGADLTRSTLPRLIARPAGDFLRGFEALRTRVAARGYRGRLVVVGAGAGGVELLLAVERRLRDDAARDRADANAMAFTLVTASDDILPGFPPRFRRLVREVLTRRDIGLRTGTRVASANDDGVQIMGQAAIGADELLWATEARASEWLAQTGLLLDADGFVRVDESLRCVGHTDVFAAGDTASFDPRPLAKSGVFAVRAGPVLAHNLRASLRGRALRAFQPQRRTLYILSTGDGRAIGACAGFTVSGRWVWWWKNWIDRRFMARYRLGANPASVGSAEG